MLQGCGLAALLESLCSGLGARRSARSRGFFVATYHLAHLYLRLRLAELSLLLFGKGNAVHERILKAGIGGKAEMLDGRQIGVARGEKQHFRAT